MNFNKEEMDLFKQWFNSVQDITPKYLEGADYLLYEKVMNHLGLRIDHRTVDKLNKFKGGTESKVQSLIDLLVDQTDGWGAVWDRLSVSVGVCNEFVLRFDSYDVRLYDEGESSRAIYLGIRMYESGRYRIFSEEYYPSLVDLWSQLEEECQDPHSGPCHFTVMKHLKELEQAVNEDEVGCELMDRCDIRYWP